MLELRNISVTYNKGTNDEKNVLKNLDLTIHNDDFICILGSNGAGKSTLYNSIIGAIPYDGEIYLDDVLINKNKKYKRMKDIGIVYQDPLKGTAPNLTVFDNILLATKKKHFSFGFKSKIKEKVIEELKAFNLGLENCLNVSANSLSGGMRQALTLYMATLSNPKMLLLDEHTAALDPNTEDVIMKITNHIILNKRIPTLMITHNLKQAVKYGNRIIILNNGKVEIDIEKNKEKEISEEELIKMYSNHLSDEDIFSIK